MISTLIQRLWRPLLAAFIGATTTLAFAPFSYWPIALVSPFLLLLLLDSQTAKAGAWIAFAWGLGQFGTGIHWVHVSIDTFGGMPKAASVFLMTLLVAYLAIYPALFGGFLNRFFPTNNRRRLLIAAPIFWLFNDWLRGWVFTGFPWLWLGYSQIDSPLNGFAPVSGVESITLMLWIIAGSLVYVLRSRKWQYLAVPVAIVGLSYALNQVQWVKLNPASKTSFALIQGNIDQKSKWLPSHRWPTLMKYTDMSRENWQSDIVIWPEAAIPALESDLPAFLQNLDTAARTNNTALITGVLSQDDMGRFYNNVLTLGKDGQGPYDYDTAKRYSKHHLLPFGEFVPFGDLLRPIAPFFNLPMSSFQRGAFIQPNLVANGRHLLAALCYEIIFSEQVRQNVTNDTDFILTLSNDAWFGRSIGPIQHMEIARMRALELGKPLIRATNNGITAVTDYRGRITKQVPQFKTEVLNAEVTSTTGNTPYRSIGSWLLYLWSVIGLGGAWLLRNRYKQR
ncbi:apolipoprotein N-acyltransferase [Vibrio sp. S11_S32]|uniref:apolipoprotein N-acyltransferase n=1 Tax=Vibrio sp. S11_S32 TaxID=2720225 RepID=UPI00168160FB|nr:apolipoprotein N-acyltransferase [Vibrio sp. S11_S32]MBD1575017.1 apolipoprotein N-acyltransferase [Vibrio sp. S11_S32]